MAGQYCGSEKKNGKWLVCVDFIDLNKACPKDPFPIPKIDQLVDAIVVMRITKHSRIHCMFQLGLLLKQDLRISKKHLMG